MSKKEFTDEELKVLIEKFSNDGKVSKNDLASIVYDSRFPEDMFKRAHEKLIEFTKEEERCKELAAILLEKYSEILDIQKEVVKLMGINGKDDNEEEEIVQKIYQLTRKQSEVQNSANELENEFNVIKIRIEERNNYKTKQ